MVNYFLLVAGSFLVLSCSPNANVKNKSNDIQTANPKHEANNLNDDINMVYFQGGTFNMGSDKGLPAEQPVHSVEVKSFKIDKYPVTVKEFRAFINATGYITDAEKFGDSGVFNYDASSWSLLPGANWAYPLGKQAPGAADNHPVTQVSWLDAMAYAKWAKKRLPTEAEWEFAARCGGTSQSKFSWGDKVEENGKYLANVWQGELIHDKQGQDGFAYTSPIGNYPETPCGMSDMGGNVWNWCADVYKPYPGSSMTIQVNETVKCTRGGSFFYDENMENSFSSTSRSSNSQETSLFNTGFRCAKDAE